MAKKDEKPDDTMWVKTASGAEFWRGGVLFNGDWREVKRADVGDTAWQRILAEPALQTKAQAN